MIDVTVIIPTRNRRAYLEEAMSSVLAQRGVELQLVVVDDASDDGTPEWLERIDDSRLVVVRLTTHSERSAARNRGFEAAMGEYVVFLDDDDRLRPEALRVMAEAMRSQPTAVVVVGARVAFDHHSHSRRGAHVRRRHVVDLWPIVLCGWGVLPGQGHSMLRTAMLQELGGWREDLVSVEDLEIWLRLSQAGPAVLVPDNVLDYRVHDGQWQPIDASEVEDEFLDRFVAGLAAHERSRGERYLRAREAILVGGRAFTAGHCAAALRSYLRAALAAPALCTSVVTRTQFAERIAKSVVGSVLGTYGVSRVRRGTAALRDIRRRNPGAGRTVTVVDQSARR